MMAHFGICRHMSAHVGMLPGVDTCWHVPAHMCRHPDCDILSRKQPIIPGNSRACLCASEEDRRRVQLHLAKLDIYVAKPIAASVVGAGSDSVCLATGVLLWSCGLSAGRLTQTIAASWLQIPVTAPETFGVRSDCVHCELIVSSAQLSCHVQNFVAITVLESRWEWSQISIEF